MDLVIHNRGDISSNFQASEVKSSVNQDSEMEIDVVSVQPSWEEFMGRFMAYQQVLTKIQGGYIRLVKF